MCVISGCELVAIYLNGRCSVELNIPYAIGFYIGTPFCAGVSIQQFIVTFYSTGNTAAFVNSIPSVIGLAHAKITCRHQAVASGRYSQIADIEVIVILILEDELHNGLLVYE